MAFMPSRPSALGVNRTLTLAALLWIAGTVVVVRQRQPTPEDLPQFYMSGLLIREGQTDDLYPIPEPGARLNAGWPNASTPRPGYQQAAQESGLPDAFRFILPPPSALLFIPISLIPWAMAVWLWSFVVALCCWGIGVIAARLHREILGRDSVTQGILVMGIAIAPMTARIIELGNTSSLVGLCAGGVVIGLHRERDSWASAGMLVGGLAKLATPVLLPLLIALRRVRLIGWLIVLALSILALTLMLGGFEPFRVFLQDIAPTLTRPDARAQGLRSLAMSIFGYLPRKVNVAITIASWTVFALLCLAIWRSRRTLAESVVHLSAGAAGLLSWLLLFSWFSWPHYLLYIFPFWGWLFWEGSKRLSVAAVVVLAVVLSSITPLWVERFVSLPAMLEPFMVVPLSIVMALAFWRLWSRDDVVLVEAAAGS
jgi:alpha-1,2-mannosyltransferase